MQAGREDFWHYFFLFLQRCFLDFRWREPNNLPTLLPTEMRKTEENFS